MRRDDIYFGVLGVAVVLAGAIATVRGIGLDVADLQSTLGVVTVSGTVLLWRGVILLSAGAFYLYGALEGLGGRETQSTVFLGSLMIWIVAGTDLLAAMLGAIPGGADVWVASGPEILAALGPPYTPSVIAAPFALAALAYRRSQEGEGP